jgi:SAM-dependent methyltransferase
MDIHKQYTYSTFKKKYLTIDREPFFELAADYIKKEDKIILDIGSGEGDFYNYLKNRRLNVDNVYMLDSNPVTVEKNSFLSPNSILYSAPNVLPFENLSVDFMHMSHLVDHLNIADFYKFLQELNRALKPGGILVVSTPLFWPRFYDDLSHVKPYNPYVFFKYFIQQGRHSRFDKIQNLYSMEKLVYRYYELPLDEGWSSTVPFLDILFITGRRILRKMGIKRLHKNGYTLVLKKGHE